MYPFLWGNCLSLFCMAQLGLQSRILCSSGHSHQSNGRVSDWSRANWVPCMGFHTWIMGKRRSFFAEGSSLKQRNLDFPETRLPLPYHQQRALFPIRDRKIKWEWAHCIERYREWVNDITPVTGSSLAWSKIHLWTSQLPNKFPFLELDFCL